MKGLLCLAAAATLATLTDAIQLTRRDKPAVVHAPVQRRDFSTKSIVKRDRVRRDNRLRKRSLKSKRSTSYVSESLANDETLYFANISLGTPAQAIELQLDTGSSDLWVNVANSTLCKEYKQDCDELGVYTPADSSTYEYVDSNFDITYVGGTGSSGIYAKDDLTIGGITLDSVQFGIGYNSTSIEGVLGISYTTDEAAVTTKEGSYPNVPKVMYNQGYINSVAYSLWLNDLEASTGNILFGGVNKDKYSGELETIPIIKVDGEYAEFLVALTAVGTNDDYTSISSDDISVVLDSGTSLTYLPTAIADAILTKYDATYNDELGAAIIDCSYADSTDTVTYTFTTPTITVALSELVLVDGTDSNGKDVCIFGIVPTSDSDDCILGDTFLRSAYVVYDLSNNQISLAQTVYNSTTDDIVEITSGTDGVPGASVVASAVSTIATSASATAAGDVVTSTSEDAAMAMVTAPPKKALAVMALAGLGAALAL